MWIIRGVFWVVLVMSMVMLFSPASDVPSGFPLNDKVVHSLLFFALIGRYGSLADFAADIAGLLLALLVVWLVGHIASAEHREETQ